jgi:alpha-glucosidase (family GH31 glycosyl hydrolase)
MRLETSDPAGPKMVVRAHADDQGLAVDVGVKRSEGAAAAVQAVRATFALSARERLVGFGERSNAVDQRGGVVENVVSEGPYQPDELPLLGPFVPGWALTARVDATYYPVPWLLSTGGYGVLVENDEPSRFRLGTDDPDGWSVEADAERLRLRLLAGPRPADALRRLTELTGRQPPAAPEVFGTWHHSENRLGDETRRIDDLQAADVPLSVAQIFTQYLPCARHRTQRERQRRRVALFHSRGLAATTYVNPHMCVEHPEWEEAVASGALTRTAEGDPYLYEFSVRRDLVGQFDFTAPAGRSLYGRLVGEALEDGHDGWMEDYGEYSPTDGMSADGRPGPVTHNTYPRDFHCATASATDGAGTLIRYVRSGWTRSARCSPVVWGGDPTVGWGFDGLRSAVTNGLTMGLSGVSTWGSDIGGFFAFFDRQLSPELLTRWIQFGAVSGVMRLQATGIAIPEKPRVQPWGPAILPQWRRWAKLRTQLFPYIEAADAEYRRSGLPIMRHLALTHPDDERAIRVDDAFMFGPDLLAAPVVDPGRTGRPVYLPRGKWVDLWRSARYVQDDGSLELQRPAMLSGARSFAVPAPLDELPLLVRAGALIPLLPPEVDTLSAYGDGPGATAISLGERALERRLLAFPRGRTSSAVGAHDGHLTSHEQGGGRWTVRFATKAPLRWQLQASLATLERPFVPCSVRLDDRPLRRGDWNFDRATGVLEATLRTRNGTLRATRACGSSRYDRR